MLHVEHLSVGFERYAGLLARVRVTALDRVSFEARAGELVAVVGASGAGKTLLAHAILGILPPNAEAAGSMTYRGQRLTPDRQRALRGREIALVPQSVAFLDPSAIARRQVGWAARSAAREDPDGAADRELARYGLDRAAGARFPHELSGGMARRVLTAIATVSQASLLVADEPTTGLDPDNARLILQTLRMLADAGKAAVVVSHALDLVLPVCDRVVVMEAGRTVEGASAASFEGGRTTHRFSRTLADAYGRHRSAAETLGAPEPRSPGPAAQGARADGKRRGLEARGLTHRWSPRGRDVLAGVDLTLAAGERIGLAGPSGSGKSTLARILGGLVQATGGTILVNGAPVPAHGSSPVQVVLQHPERAFNPRRRIRSSLHEGGTAAADLLDAFAIDRAWLDRFPHEVSGGELQRIAIARALVPNLQVLVADEITASLDVLSQERIWAGLLGILHQRRVSLVVISHDRALLRRLGARCLVLQDGRLVPSDAACRPAPPA